jgi:hypothetical protein
MNGKLFYPVDINLKYWMGTDEVFKHLWRPFLIAHIVNRQDLTLKPCSFSNGRKILYIPLMFCPQSRLSSSQLEYFRVNLYLKISRFYFAFFLL